MLKRKIPAPAMLCWIAAVVILSASCSKGDDVEAVRKLIDKGVDLGEKHDIGKLMELASDDFIALPGDLDRRAVRAILWRAFNHYGPLNIAHPRPSVEVDEDGKRASAGLFFLIVRKDMSFPKLKDLPRDPGGWLDEVGENADLYRLEMELAKEKREWLVRKATLKRFGEWFFLE